MTFQVSTRHVFPRPRDRASRCRAAAAVLAALALLLLFTAGGSLFLGAAQADEAAAKGASYALFVSGIT